MVMNLELRPLDIHGVDFSRRPLVAAGPCSAETESQVMETASALAAAGVRIFRAGIWKPRTKPGCFEGVGEKGLPWMRRVKDELGMSIATEVASPAHVKAALEAGMDILWVGARTVVNPFAVQDLAEAIGGWDVPVLVKNPVNPDIELWVGALERLNACGITRLGAIHRGFSTYGEQCYRNTPMWNIPIELHRRVPSLPIFCDPSHIAGRRDLIAKLSQQAMDVGFEGLFIESHCNPDEAWSDAAQQVTPIVLAEILERIVVRDTHDGGENLEMLRGLIDECDDTLLTLLARRMNVSDEIGRYKRQHGMSVVQSGRYSQILAKLIARGEQLGLDRRFVKILLEAIHNESVNRQIRILSDPQE